MTFERPNVVLSKCLEFEAVRYNGQLIQDDFVRKLAPFVRYLPVCPEVEIGLGVPRHPVRIVGPKSAPRLVQPATRQDLTQKMSHFAGSYLADLKDIDGFILKSRSPSCGLKDVKVHARAEESPVIGKGSGFFAAAVLERFPGLAIEDEGRLKNLRLREHFLTRLFALARLRRVREASRMSALVEFHARHKFLLMAYTQAGLRALGRLVANQAQREPVEVFSHYQEQFARSLLQPPKRSNVLNALSHLGGYFSRQLSAGEKKFFRESMGLYREGRIPFSSVMHVLKSWAIRFQNDYLLQQVFFHPYPEDLMELRDSGRALDL